MCSTLNLLLLHRFIRPHLLTLSIRPQGPIGRYAQKYVLLRATHPGVEPSLIVMLNHDWGPYALGSSMVRAHISTFL